MNPIKSSFVSLFTIVAAIFFACTVDVSAQPVRLIDQLAPTQDDSKETAIVDRLQREQMDDPPGVVPSNPLAVPPIIARSPAGLQIVQVNVNSEGLNIVGDAANEPSIAVDPTDPNRVVIGWRQFDTVNSNFRQAGWGYSVDAGQSWTFPGRIQPGVFRSDPVLGSDVNGRIYYYSLQGDFSTDFFISDDGGQTWGPQIPAFGGDKQWFSIDNTAGPGAGHVYATWSTAGGCCGNRTFFRSTDGLQSIENPIVIPQTPRWGTTCVGPNGDIFVSGINQSGDFAVVRSSNAQFEAQAPTFTAVNVNLGGSQSAFNSNSPNPGGLLGQAYVATNPNNNEVYLLCSVDPPGSDPLDVRFARSTDNGQTWSNSVRVNDVQNGWQWFGCMSVAPDGRIDVVWNDTRNDPTGNFSELFYSYSTDGGQTWAANQQLSPAYNHFLGYPQQNKMGDYYHMVSRPEGAYLAWAATFNGEQDVYFTFIPNPVISTELTGFQLLKGTQQAGDLADLTQSDDNYLQIRSGFGSTLADLHLMELAVFATTTVPAPATIDVTIESRIDQPTGIATVFLRNWNSNNFEQVGQYSVGNTDATQVIGGINATNYVNGNGDIDVKIKHVVFRPFLAFQFDSFFDLIQVDVN